MADFVNVRNRTTTGPHGWIEITAMPDSRWVMKSELNLWTEGMVVPFDTEYFPADHSAHLELAGLARSFKVLDIREEDQIYKWVMLSNVGTNIAYSVECSTGQAPLTWTAVQTLQYKEDEVFCRPPTNSILFRGVSRPR